MFAGVGLLLGLCGIVQAAPAQQHTRCGQQSDPQSTSSREGPMRKGPNNNQNPITYRIPAQKV